MPLPELTKERAAIDRMVIEAARAIERAAQYGIPTGPAIETYEATRRAQALVSSR